MARVSAWKRSEDDAVGIDAYSPDAIREAVRREWLLIRDDLLGKRLGALGIENDEALIKHLVRYLRINGDPPESNTVIGAMMFSAITLVLYGLHDLVAASNCPVAQQYMETQVDETLNELAALYRSFM